VKACVAALLFAAPTLAAVPTLAAAGELSPIVGRYSYADYAVTLPSGRVLHLRDLNATGASLEITDSGTVTLRMTMSSGEIVVQKAHLLEAHLANGVGFWRARWPDMNYAVRTDITVKDGILTTVIKFDNPADEQRYGSVERATLRRVPGR
jgi:hypothetical protein